MLFLNDVRDFVANLVNAIGIDEEHVYSGLMPDKKEKSLGVYNQKRGTPKQNRLDDAASYRRKSVSILVHWNQEQPETERAAAAVYSVLEKAQRQQVNGVNILFTKMSMEEAVDVGVDDEGIFEMVIELDIFYERKGEG